MPCGSVMLLHARDLRQLVLQALVRALALQALVRSLAPIRVVPRHL